MAATYAFQPFGLSSRVTVVASAGTLHLSVVQVGGSTATLTASTALYQPQAVRVVNDSSVAAFIQFGNSTVTVGVNTGIEILGNSIEVFSVRGMPYMAFISGGTLTLGITVGEGV